VTRVGNSVIFLHDCQSRGLLEEIDGLPKGVFANDTLNEFAALPRPIQRRVRKAIQDTWENGSLDVTKFPLASVEHITLVQMHMPVRVGDFAG
jgi:fumarylacetoacetase